MRTELGKIKRIHVGIGGYQDAQLGVFVQLGGESWGVADSRATWATHSDHCKWTVAEQRNSLGDVMFWLRDLLQDAKCMTVDQLVGKPIEATFDGMTLKSWRILKEVL